MKDDHMRNAQLKPGYNVQIAVDSEYIVATEIFQDRNDVWTLVPFLKDMETKLGFRYPSVTADSGYESEEAYEYLRKAGQKAYIKPQSYEKWKKQMCIRDRVKTALNKAKTAIESLKMDGYLITEVKDAINAAKTQIKDYLSIIGFSETSGNGDAKLDFNDLLSDGNITLDLSLIHI